GKKGATGRQPGSSPGAPLGATNPTHHRSHYHNERGRMTAPILVGPADAESFRLKEHYGRVYTDPLPTCDIAPESDKTYPSFSATKPPFSLGAFTLKRAIANMPDAEWQRIAALPADERLDALTA